MPSFFYGAPGMAIRQPDTRAIYDNIERAALAVQATKLDFAVFGISEVVRLTVDPILSQCLGKLAHVHME